MNLQQAIKLLEQLYERAQQISFVRNPLAWALFKVWKKADEQTDWSFDTRIAQWDEWWPSDCAQILTGEEKLYQCSSCTAKYEDIQDFRYCPNCGAFMYGGCDNAESNDPT